MKVRLQNIEKLAKQLENTVEAVTKILNGRGIVVLNGYYDDALFQATYREPSVDSRKRIDWGLSDRLGIGAAKALLDPLNIRITIHDPKRGNHLLLKKSGVYRYIKWQYSNYLNRGTEAQMTVTNVNVDSMYTHYLFTCFEGPYGWAIPQRDLRNAHAKLLAGEEVPGFTLPKAKEKHPGGVLKVRLDTTAAKFSLKTAKQLGF